MLVYSPLLARQLNAIFERQSAGERAWIVLLDDDRLAWTDGSAEFASDPMASSGQRFRA
ncbi:hypothetical protein [Thiocapsa sp.]|uniref:hypothetical protein n=1 Tax=Thiocapsa sp. TaxID=2024551 RepID=UPI00359398F8